MRKMITLFAVTTLLASTFAFAESGPSNDVLQQIPHQDQSNNEGPAPLSIADATPAAAEPADAKPAPTAPAMTPAAPHAHKHHKQSGCHVHHAKKHCYKHNGHTVCHYKHRHHHHVAAPVAPAPEATNPVNQ
jgi:hypothetical protein